MKRLILLSWLLALLINPDLISQSRVKIRNSFYDAESLFLYESYKDALPIYLSLLKTNPDNSNYKYRIGQCYLNIDGEKKRAISYLEEAVKNIDPVNTEGKYGEKGAPNDALFYLARAYMINYQLDKALETYELFKDRMSNRVYDTSIVNFQIQSCLNARTDEKTHLSQQKSLGKNINGSNSDFYPVVSDDEDLMVFSRSMPFYDAILYTKRINGEWSAPVNMNELLKVDRDLYPTSLSKDNKTLYLYSASDYDGTIFTSRNENGKWSPIVKLNGNINTKYWESHATISHDNSKLYFTSNRNGTLGGLDIYVSSRDSKGDWGPAVNLGPVINTPYNEESPFLSEDDKTLYFSSRGHLNMGGYDIFYSSLLDNGTWSVPLNIGYPLNTTDNDLFYKPQKDGFEGFIARENPGGTGKRDIYRVVIFTEDHPRKFIVRGKAQVDELNASMKNKVRISARNMKKGGQELVFYTNPETGEYTLNIPQGDYEITYESEGSTKIVRNLNIPLTNPSDSLELPMTLLSKAELAELSKAGKDETVPGGKTSDKGRFPMKAKPKGPVTGEQGQIVNQSISDKDIAALYESLLKRATGDLLDVIANAGVADQKFGKRDDLISYLKEEASKKSVNPENLDKLALKVAVMDDILTQAAVDLLEKYTDGDLKKILSGVDIYESNLRTWTDLLEYISSMSGGKYGPEDLNKIAAEILADSEAAIAKLREKIMTFSQTYKEGNVLRNSIATIDKNNILLKEKWLQAFYNEAVKQGLTPAQLSEMLVTISSFPGTGVEQYLSDLIKFSEAPLHSSLISLDLSKEKIKSPADLIMFLLNHRDNEKYPEEPVFKSIANLILANDIPSDIITSQLLGWKGHKSWILWILIGAGLILFFIIFLSRKKDKPKQMTE